MFAHPEPADAALPVPIPPAAVQNAGLLNNNDKKRFLIIDNKEREPSIVFLVTKTI